MSTVRVKWTLISVLMKMSSNCLFLCLKLNTNMYTYYNLCNTTEHSVITIPFQHYNIHYLQPHHLIIFIFISMSCNSNPQVPLEKAGTQTVPLVCRNFAERSIHLVFLWSIQDEVGTGLVSPPASEATVFESVLLTHTSSILSPHG